MESCRDAILPACHACPTGCRAIQAAVACCCSSPASPRCSCTATRGSRQGKVIRRLTAHSRDPPTGQRGSADAAVAGHKCAWRGPVSTSARRHGRTQHREARLPWINCFLAANPSDRICPCLLRDLRDLRDLRVKILLFPCVKWIPSRPKSRHQRRWGQRRRIADRLTRRQLPRASIRRPRERELVGA